MPYANAQYFNAAAAVQTWVLRRVDWIPAFKMYASKALYKFKHFSFKVIFCQPIFKEKNMWRSS